MGCQRRWLHVQAPVSRLPEFVLLIVVRRAPTSWGDEGVTGSIVSKIGGKFCFVEGIAENLLDEARGLHMLQCTTILLWGGGVLELFPDRSVMAGCKRFVSRWGWVWK